MWTQLISHSHHLSEEIAYVRATDRAKPFRPAPPIGQLAAAVMAAAVFRATTAAQNGWNPQILFANNLTRVSRRLPSRP
jgi:hypothetical protein